MLSGQDVGSVPLWLSRPYRSDSGSQNFPSTVQSQSHPSASASSCNPPFQQGWQHGFRCPHYLNSLIYRHFWFIKGDPPSQASYSFTEIASNHPRICFPQQIKPSSVYVSIWKCQLPLQARCLSQLPSLMTALNFNATISSSHLQEPCQDSPQRRRNGQDPLIIPVDKERWKVSAGITLCLALPRESRSPSTGNGAGAALSSMGRGLAGSSHQ